MQKPRNRLTVKRLMIAVALVAIILGASIWGVKLKGRRAKGSHIAFLYSTYEKSSRRMFDRFRREAMKHVATAEEKRLDARNSQNSDLRKILEDAAKDADKRASYWASRARPYHEEAQAYSRLTRMFEKAANRPWEPLPPIPVEWPLTWQ